MAAQQAVQVTLAAGIREGWICSMGFSLEAAAEGPSPGKVLVGVGFLGFAIDLVFLNGIIFSGFFVRLLFPFFRLRCNFYCVPCFTTGEL